MGRCITVLHNEWKWVYTHARTHTHKHTQLSNSMHNPGLRQKGKPCDSNLVMDQIDLIHCAGQFLILNPQDVSEWILCGRPIQLFSLTSTHETLRQRASERKHRQTKEQRERSRSINYLHTKLIWSHSPFCWHFTSYKRKHFYAFGAFMLDVCISLKASPWRGWPVWFLTFPSKKAKKGYFQPFITFIEYSCRERRPTLFILGGLRTLSRAELCALQRAAWNGGEICWKCLENSRPCSPRRAPSIIGLAVSLCSLAATLSTHKSLLPNPALLLLHSC